MKNILLLSILSLIISCAQEEQKISQEIIPDTHRTINEDRPNSTFQEILDSAQLKGAILVYDPQDRVYHTNDLQWALKGQLPASTFKIPNSMIALETSVVQDENTLLKWDGEPKWIKTWEQDLIFKDAFKFSCVPCYREIARNIGVERMNIWLDSLNYFSSFKPDSTNLDLFWLEGNARISPYQEIDFLYRLHHSQLPIAKRTEKLVKEIMILDKNKNYTLRGKTGWTINGDQNNGWFVGYVERDRKVFFFATNVEPDNGFDMKDFPAIRKVVTMAALKSLEIIKE